MFTLWRQAVKWLRTLLLTIFQKKPIDWHKTIKDALDIAKNVNDKLKPSHPDTPPTIPDYDLIGVSHRKTPLRDFFKKLRKKQ
jgi:hypothetical protein